MIHGGCIVPSLPVSSMFSSVTDKLERRKDSQEGCEAERAVTIERSCPAGFLAHSLSLGGEWTCILLY